MKTYLEWYEFYLGMFKSHGFYDDVELREKALDATDWRIKENRREERRWRYRRANVS